MTRVLLSVYSLIVLISFVHHPVSSTTTVTPSPTVPPSSPTALANATSASAYAASTGPAVSGSITPSVTITAGLGGNGTTSLNTSQIAPTTSGNVAASSSAPSEPKRFQAKVTVDADYESDYDDINSNKYIFFVNNFTSNLESFLNRRFTGNITINVTELSNGSVVVTFEIIATQSNATASNIQMALDNGSNTGILGYTLIGEIIVGDVQKPSATVSVTVSVSPSKSAPVTKPTTAPPISTTKGTEIWDKAIDLATPMGTFIIVVVAVALILILLIALICVCCKYRSLKKRTHFPDHMAINDSEWIRSSDDLLMWERNLRASEVKTTNGISNRPINDKRT